MKKKKFAGLIILTVIFLLAVSLCGCSGQDEADGHDVLETPELTVKYLSEEYSEQILRDGGKETLGTISINKGHDSKYSLTVHSMVIVESSITEEGYYIADKNISETVPLDPDADVTYIKDESIGPEIVQLDEFISLVQEDNAKAAVSGEEKLYDVYIIGGNALMILARELPDA